MRPDYRDVVLILDDDLAALLARPRMHVASIRGLAHVVDYILKLRARLAGQHVLVHHVMLDVAQKLGVDGGAMGPIAFLTDAYGQAAVDEPQVIEFFKTWIESCKQAR